LPTNAKGLRAQVFHPIKQFNRIITPWFASQLSLFVSMPQYIPINDVSSLHKDIHFT
jgi:hypothetical protein